MSAMNIDPTTSDDTFVGENPERCQRLQASEQYRAAHSNSDNFLEGIYFSKNVSNVLIHMYRN